MVGNLEKGLCISDIEQRIEKSENYGELTNTALACTATFLAAAVGVDAACL